MPVSRYGTPTRYLCRHITKTLWYTNDFEVNMKNPQYFAAWPTIIFSHRMPQNDTSSAYLCKN